MYKRQAAQFLGKILQTWNAQSWNKKDKEEFLDVADNLKKRIASITEPNGTFDTDKRTLLAGEPVTVSFSCLLYTSDMSFQRF